VAQARAPLPLLQRLPQDIGEEADEDVGLHAVFAWVPDGADGEVALVDAEGGLGIGQLVPLHRDYDGFERAGEG
jgi:hypothetical protein